MHQLEERLQELLVTKAPFQLPENARVTLVKAVPWLTLIGGILTVFGVWGLYRLATATDNLSTYVNVVGQTYDINTTVSGVSPLVWLSLVVLAVEAVLFFVAFPALKDRQKKGWNILYWLSLVNVVYALLYLFVDGQIGSFIVSLLSTVVGLYLLFQIRSYYLGANTTTKSAHARSDQAAKTTTAKKSS